MNDPTKVETLPPESGQRSRAEPLFRWVALVMDELLRVPGTKFRFGIDPIVGLIPGLGDSASALVSALALIQAARLGVPKILLARMSVNILLNELVGVIPVAGDAFSFWFKSNTRNHQLLRAHLGQPHRRTTADWIFVGAVLALVFIVVGAGVLVSFLFLRAICHLLGLG